MSLDTTFEFGNFYVTIIIFRDTELLEESVTPFLFLIHDRKLEEVHAFFLYKLARRHPEIVSAGVEGRLLITTDNEAAIVNSVRTNLPGVPYMLCYIHKWNNIKAKLKNLHITDADVVKRYKAICKALLRCESRAACDQLLLKLATEWNKVSFDR